MKLKFSENPKEWRKSGVLGAIGFAVLSSLLHWRHHLGRTAWIGLLIFFGVVLICAIAQPRWFRGWYRVSGWVAFHIGQAVGYVVFALAFVVIITPAGLILRLGNRDPLRLKRDKDAASYWSKAREVTPLDRMF